MLFRNRKAVGSICSLRYAVIPKVTIRIETKSDVASIQEVGTQHPQLIRGERLNEVSRRSRERLLRQ